LEQERLNQVGFLLEAIYHLVQLYCAKSSKQATYHYTWADYSVTKTLSSLSPKVADNMGKQLDQLRKEAVKRGLIEE